MSVIEKTRRREAPSTPPKTRVNAAAPSQPQPQFSGGPRVDLLPPMVEVRRKQTATVRLLMLSLVGIVLVIVVASLAVALLAGAAENALKQEQQRSAQLISAQQQYAELIDVKTQLSEYDSAELAALYADADFTRIMQQIDAALPAGTTLATEAISVKGLSGADASSPTEESVTIDQPGVIEVRFSAAAPTFDSPAPLLNALAGVVGYVSANVSAVANSDQDGYVITAVVRLGADALGGTARTKVLDQDALVELHNELFTVVTTPPSAPVDTTDGTSETTGTGN